ncbi:MAG: acyl-CoA dehydrogenase family protein, partial [Pseudomonadota bacterium]
MDLSYSPDEQAFQAEVRQFLADELPADIAEKVRLDTDLTKDDMERWHAILNTRGWLAQNWPKAFGGAEWSAVQRHIYDTEAA